MKYIKVNWRHSFELEPIVIYSELDSASLELRKIEILKDGRMDYAGEGISRGNAKLSEEPIPTLKEIAGDPQFEPSEITKEEFDEMWVKAGHF